MTLQCRVFGVLFSLPLGVVQRLVQSETGDAFCNEIWPDLLAASQRTATIDDNRNLANVSAIYFRNLTAVNTGSVAGANVLKTTFDICSFFLQWVSFLQLSFLLDSFAHFSSIFPQVYFSVVHSSLRTIT